MIVVTALGDRLREARLQKGFTLEQAAERIGVRLNTVWRYEKGAILPSEPVLKLCCQIYEKSLEWFYGDEEDQTPPLTEEEQAELESDRELVMNEASVALRSASPNLSDEAIRSIAAFIRFVDEEEAREREEQERSES